jgi:hypothetical protein
MFCAKSYLINFVENDVEKKFKDICLDISKNNSMYHIISINSKNKSVFGFWTKKVKIMTLKRTLHRLMELFEYISCAVGLPKV